MQRYCLLAVFILMFTAHAFTPLSSGARAQNQAASAFDDLRVAGFAALYNLDYTLAGAQFDEMIKLDPAHPAGHLYLATSRWLSILKAMRRLQLGLYTNDTFYLGSEDKVEPELDQGFREAVNKAIILARAHIRNQPNDVIGHYYLGAAFGLITTYEASVTRNFKPALKNAQLGVKAHAEVVKLDPNFADAYLSLGLYHYFVGKLPWLTRQALKLAGVNGNRQQGLAELLQAMERGKYTNEDARTVLVAVYQRERRYNDALKLLDELRQKYPRNYLFSMERATVLGQLGKSCESYAAFEQVLKDEAAQTLGDLIHYRYGEALLAGGEFKHAAAQFVAVTATPKADEALVSLAQLRHGQALDAAGERAAARTQYQLVLQRENAFDSHSLARKYNDKPFALEKARQEQCGQN